MHRYRAYELSVASEIELPELGPERPADGGAPDLTVRLGVVPGPIEAPVEAQGTWAARPGAWRHEVDGVARYYVHDTGREVVIEPTGGSPADVRAYFFGSTLGAILHQQRLFVLHASAVVGPDGAAVAVAGPSGAGKSTTLTALARRGHAMLSDDKTVVRFDQGVPTVLSGYPTVRLWDDAVARVGADPATLARLLDRGRKYLYHPAGFRTEPAPLRALVVLGKAREGTPATPVASELLDPHQAVGVVLRQTYRRRMVRGEGLEAEHFAWAAQLAATVPIVRVVRARDAESVEAVADRVEEALAASVSAPTAEVR